MEVSLKNRFSSLEDQIADRVEYDENEKEDETDNSKEPEAEIESGKRKTDILSKRKKSVNDGERAELDERIDNLIEESAIQDEIEMLSFINIASLLPEQLLTIDIKIGSVKTKALLDTGADNNLMKKSVCSEANLKLNKNKTISMRGVGTENSTTEGRVMTDCAYYGVKARNTQFDVVEDELIGYPIILSRKFCEQQKLVLDIKNEDFHSE